MCLAHAGDDQRKATLKQLGETGNIDARGTPITQTLLKQVLGSAPHDADNHPTFLASRFDGATFQLDAGFDGVIFQRDAWFGEATFQGNAGFGGATFGSAAWFGGATFQGDAGFDRATFQGDAGFLRAIFQGDAGFDGATFQRAAGFLSATFQHTTWFREAIFQGDAGFDTATFQRDAWFGGATFQGDAGFDRATFGSAAWFGGATFQRDAGFGGAIFQRAAGFDGATFERARQIGPLLAYRGLGLDDVQFAQQVQIEASTIGVCCRRARFSGGMQFRLRWARVLLDDAELAAPSILAGISRLTSDRLAEQEQRIAKAWQRLLGGAISEQPRLLSLRRANVAGLGLASVELGDCRFAGAHNLDKLRLEADVSFASAPVRLGWDWRQVIAEERAWRARRSGRWTNPVWPAWADKEPAVLEAAPIAELYRALRKGREDTKDEPGAADFYYGEMEMRRARRSHGNAESYSRTAGASRGRVERGVLTAYWLVSGYGLRAWRALVCLVCAVIVATVSLRTVGFTHHRHPWSSAFLYTAGAVTHLVNPPDGLLTEPGQAIRIAIGLLGPVLLGLTLLALRGRVKR